MDLFNENSEEEAKEEEPTVDPFTFTLDLLLSQYPLVIVKYKLKEANIRGGDKWITQAKKAIAANAKADASVAADYYTQTLRLIIAKSITSQQFNAALSGLKEMRDFMQLNPSANESKVMLNVNFLNELTPNSATGKEKTKSLNLDFEDNDNDNDNN